MVVKIDLKVILGFIATSLFGILTWALITLVDIKATLAGAEAELFHINKQIVVDEVNKYALGCTKKTKELLDWEATVSLEEGLKTLVDYARKMF